MNWNELKVIVLSCCVFFFPIVTLPLPLLRFSLFLLFLLFQPNVNKSARITNYYSIVKSIMAQTQRHALHTHTHTFTNIWFAFAKNDEKKIGWEQVLGTVCHVVVRPTSFFFLLNVAVATTTATTKKKESWNQIEVRSELVAKLFTIRQRESQKTIRKIYNRLATRLSGTNSLHTIRTRTYTYYTRACLSLSTDQTNLICRYWFDLIFYSSSPCTASIFVCSSRRYSSNFKHI